MQNLTDEELMLSYQKGETQSMDELLRRYKSPIYHYVFRLSQNAADAQDIAQEVFLRVHRFRQNYQPTGKFSTWIFSIAHNLCVSRLRRKKWLVSWPRKKVDSDAMMDFESQDPSPQEVCSDNEIIGLIKECIQGLPFLQREALILREYENLDYQEIAGILKQPLGTIKTLIYRARQNLKNKLLPYIEEGGLK